MARDAAPTSLVRPIGNVPAPDLRSIAGDAGAGTGGDAGTAAGLVVRGLELAHMSRCAVTLPRGGCAEALVDGRLPLPHHGLPALADGHDSVKRPADVDADPLDPAIRE